jgi:hypothetical protein
MSPWTRTAGPARCRGKLDRPRAAHANAARENSLNSRGTGSMMARISLGSSGLPLMSSRLPKWLVHLAPPICRRKAHIPQLHLFERGEKCALSASRVPFFEQRCTSFQCRRRQRASAVHLCFQPSDSLRHAIARRSVSMLEGCPSCHVCGCHDSCSCTLRIPISCIACPHGASSHRPRHSAYCCRT